MYSLTSPMSTSPVTDGVAPSPCACRNKLIYSCQGCGRPVMSLNAIQYNAATPYPHTKWFCNLDCVKAKQQSMIVYCQSGDIDPSDEWIVHYYQALDLIQRTLTTDPTMLSVQEGINFGPCKPSMFVGYATDCATC
jgi:hypothetical protein